MTKDAKYVRGLELFTLAASIVYGKVFEVCFLAKGMGTLIEMKSEAML